MQHLKKFSRCAGSLSIVILSTQRIPGGDLVENRCFIEVKLVNVCRFSDFDRGTMRQKMAIFKERNSVCRVQKHFRSHFIYTKNFQGGDATENRDFQREKQRLQGSKIFSDAFSVFSICEQIEFR